MATQSIHYSIQLLEWNDTFRVGIANVDEQHQRLFAIANGFFNEVALGKQARSILEALDRLADYATEHFTEEETLMKIHRFPNRAQHIDSHRYFTRQISQLRRELFEGNQTLALDLLAFLREWLVEHVLGSDNYLGSYIQEQKAKRHASTSE